MKMVFLGSRAAFLLMISMLLLSMGAYASPKKLVISLPAGWTLQVSEVKGNVMYQQRVQRRNGKDIQHLQLTAMQPVRKPEDFKPINDGSIKKLAESLRESVLKISTDKTIPLQKLPSGRGYYFVANDANTKPRPDEYPQLIQGVMIVDGNLLNFTILTSDAQSAEAKAALSAMDRVSIR